MKKTIFAILFIVLSVNSNAISIGQTTESPAKKITFVKEYSKMKLYHFVRPKYWLNKTKDWVMQFNGPAKHGVYFTIMSDLRQIKSQGGHYTGVKAYFASLEKQWKTAKKYRRHSKRKIRIGKYNGTEMIVSYVYKGKKYQTQQIIFLTKKGYLIRIAYTGPAQAFSDYSLVMQKMISSLKVKS